MRKGVLCGMTLLLGFVISLSAAAQSEEVAKYIARTETELSSIQNYQITYFGVLHSEPLSVDSPEYADFTNSIREMEQIKAKLLSNNLTDREKAQYSRLTIADIDKSIESQQKMIAGEDAPTIHIYSRNDFNQRLDIIRPENEELNQIYLFDGYEGVMITEKDQQKNVKLGPTFTMRWKKPGFAGGFGFNLNCFLGDGYCIDKIDSTNNQIKVISQIYLPENTYYLFTLLEDNNSYWKVVEECNEDGAVLHRIQCDNFAIESGVLIPHNLVFQARNKAGALFVYSTLELIDAKINDAVFAENFFDKPAPSDVKDIVMMKR
jgi:hypothetical protein